MTRFHQAITCLWAITLLALSLLLTPADAQEACPTYGMDTQCNIIEYNPVIGTETKVVTNTLPPTPTSGTSVCNSVAFDALSSSMFFLHVFTSSDLNGLYYWDQQSPGETVVKIASLSMLTIGPAQVTRAGQIGNAAFANGKGRHMRAQGYIWFSLCIAN
jgi:hypothetical protein